VSVHSFPGWFNRHYNDVMDRFDSIDQTNILILDVMERVVDMIRLLAQHVDEEVATKADIDRLMDLVNSVKSSRDVPRS